MADETKKPMPTMLEKKAQARWKSNFDLHVLMIMRTHDVAKSVAQAQAYHEGWEGCGKRLGE